MSVCLRVAAAASARPAHARRPSHEMRTFSAVDSRAACCSSPKMSAPAATFTQSFGIFGRLTSTEKASKTMLPTTRIELLSISAQGLAVGSFANRSSNPYLVFHCDAMADSVRSEVQPFTLDPKF